MERPGSLPAVTAILAVVNVVTLAAALLAGVPPDATGTKIFAVLCALLVATVTRSFWRGRNSARVFFMGLSGFLVVNALMGARVAHTTYLYMIGLAAFGIFLLFYLNRPDIRAWFSIPSAAASRRGEDQKPGIGRAK
jgi:hypothetical protein